MSACIESCSLLFVPTANLCLTSDDYVLDCPVRTVVHIPAYIARLPYLAPEGRVKCIIRAQTLVD